MRSPCFKSTWTCRAWGTPLRDSGPGGNGSRSTRTTSRKCADRARVARSPVRLPPTTTARAAPATDPPEAAPSTMCRVLARSRRPGESLERARAKTLSSGSAVTRTGDALLDQMLPQRDRDRLGAVLRAQLREEPPEVRLHGVLGDRERGADLLVAVSVGDGFEDLDLARGEVALRALDPGVGGHPAEHGSGDLGLQEAAPGVHRTDGADA